MMTQDVLTPLRQTPLFENLDDQTYARVSEYLDSRRFATGSMILTEGQPGEVVYIILSGTVKIFTTQLDGSEVIISVMGAGEIVGEMSLVDSIGRSASAVTLEDSLIAWMNKPDFHYCLEHYPKISLNLIRILTARLRFNTELIQSYAGLDVNGRVARQLLAFADKYGKPEVDGATLIPVSLPQSEIAGLVGASRKRVNQIMVQFKRQGLIEVDAGYRITLLDQDGLKRFCE